MKRIDGYILRTVASTTLAALLVLLALELFLTLMVELKSVGKANYGLAAALRYLLLLQPQFLYELFPMALLVGALLGMGGLASSSELIAMRAAGWSLARLTRAALQAGLLLSLGVLVVGEFAAPPLEQLARQQRATALGEGLAIRGGLGFWARDGNSFIHIQAVLPGVRLEQINAFTLGADAQLEALTTAQSARYMEGRWKLAEVSRSQFSENRVETQQFEHLLMPSAINPQILEVLAARPNDLSIRDLQLYISYLESNGLSAQTYRLALWRKLCAPLTYLAMLVVAMPFVFGPQRSTGTGQRLLAGLLLGLVFFLSNYLLGNVVLLYGLPPVLGAILPPLLFLVGGFEALRRQR